MLDECHKAKQIDLDYQGNAQNIGSKGGSSKTGERVVALQKQLPHARVVYCSATAASELKNLGYMTRLGLWGTGTEHQTYKLFLENIGLLGTGAMELIAVHLKSIGAMTARMLSCANCQFDLIECDIGNFGQVNADSKYFVFSGEFY